MSAGLTVESSIVQAALKDAFAEQFAALDVESLTLVDAKQAAKWFGITPRSFREIAADTFDFGPCRTRWSVKELRVILEKRRVKARN